MKTSLIFIKAGVFFLPVLLYVGISYFVLSSGGEFASIHDVAEYQLQDERIIFGRGFRDEFNEYKLISTRLRHPAVLALGSSRSMQYRSAMFEPGSHVFYNAGGTINSIYGLRLFLEQLDPQYYPEVLILPLDPEWFNPYYSNATFRQAIAVSEETDISLATMLNLSRLLFVDLVNGRRNLSELIDRVSQGQDPLYHAPAIGLDALTVSNGFRSDGSRVYGHLILAPQSVEERFAEVRERMGQGIRRMEYSDTLYEEAFDELSRLYTFCKENSIQVVSYSPPYPPSIYDEIENSHHYEYLKILPERLEQIALAEGYPYHNFLDGEKVATDEDFLDGFHGSDYVYLNMLIAFTEQSPDLLAPFVSLAHLKEIAAAHTSGDLDPFGNVRA
jgi:hypothetical protein